MNKEKRPKKPLNKLFLYQKEVEKNTREENPKASKSEIISIIK